MFLHLHSSSAQSWLTSWPTRPLNASLSPVTALTYLHREIILYYRYANYTYANYLPVLIKGVMVHWSHPEGLRLWFEGLKTTKNKPVCSCLISKQVRHLPLNWLDEQAGTLTNAKQFVATDARYSRGSEWFELFRCQDDENGKPYGLENGLEMWVSSGSAQRHAVGWHRDMRDSHCVLLQNVKWGAVALNFPRESLLVPNSQVLDLILVCLFFFTSQDHWCILLTSH